MKRFGGLCVLYIISTGPLLAGLSAVPATLDLGRRSQNVTAEGHVMLTNTGSSELEILGVGADCSCTAAVSDKKKLMPGESTDLTITSQSRHYQGAVRRTIQVATSEGELAIPVTMLVTAYENCLVSPSTLVLKPSYRGEVISGEVTLTYLGTDSVAIKSLMVDPPFAEAVLTKTEQQAHVITVRKLADAPAGNYSVRVIAELNDREHSRITFEVFMTVLSSLRLTPSPLVMPSIRGGQRSEITAKLTGWASESPPKVELDGGVVTTTKKEHDTYEIKVVVEPTQAGVFTRLLRISSADALELEVPVILRVEK